MDKILRLIPQLKMSEAQWAVLAEVLQAIGAAAADGKFSTIELWGIMTLLIKFFNTK